MWQLLQSPRFRAKYFVTWCVTVGMFFTVGPGFVQALSDTHSISGAITDLIGPTAPSSVSASTDSTTVTLSWIAGTDDQGVFQYRVTRDGESIGTTADLTFIDTPLVDGTYVYTVITEDFGGNTSTPATLTVTKQSGGGGGGGSSRSLASEPSSVLESLAFQEVVGGVVANMEFSDPAQVVIRYGATPAYELGSVEAPDFKTEHDIMLLDLTPNNQYYYEITVTTDNEDIFVVTDSFVVGQISTQLTSNGLHVVQDVSGYRIAITDKDVSTITVVYQTTRPPLDQFDGDLVYKGDAETVALGFQTGYYTVFVTTKNGTTYATVLPVGVTNQVVTTVSGPSVAGLSWSTDIELYQGTQSLPVTDQMTIYAGVPITLRYPKGASVDGGVAYFSNASTSLQTPMQLLLADDDATYHVTVPIPDVSGTYDLIMQLYNGDQVVATFGRQIVIAPFADITPEKPSGEAVIRAILIKIITALQALFTF